MAFFVISEYKLCLLVFLSLHGAAPEYLCDCCIGTHSSASGLRLRSLEKIDRSPGAEDEGLRTSAIVLCLQGRRPMGGLGGTVPQNLRWGTAHALVPPIFIEAALSDARESMNRVKKGVFLVRKG